MTLNVLCVDDEPETLSTHKIYFQMCLTPNVDTAKDISSALQKIRETKYDLIILDGLEEQCFRLFDDIKEIPHGDVMILSGDSTVESMAKEKGIPFYSKKDRNALEKIVEKYKKTE